MPESTIRHDPNLPWGWWMRTVSSPQGDIIIVDEHGNQWPNLREAFWCGRLGMRRDNQRILDENLELMLALLASKARGVVSHIQNVHELYGSDPRFYRWWTYWLLSVGLTDDLRAGTPFEATVTAEGESVVRMLLATRSPQLAAVPIGKPAMATFGPPGSATECDRARFDAVEGKARALPFGLVRETLFGKPVISMLHRNLDDAIPLARTVWSLALFDEPSRDRLYLWMHDRLDRWTAWGEVARSKGAAALTQHLMALVALGEQLGTSQDSQTGAATGALAITNRD